LRSPPTSRSATLEADGRDRDLLISLRIRRHPAHQYEVEVEINSREHFAVYGFKRMPFSVSSRWFKGQCEISTYEPALQAGMPCEIRVNKAKLTRRSKAALATTVLSYWLCGDILVGAQGLEPWTR
jgi:hypothetical protein